LYVNTNYVIIFLNTFRMELSTMFIDGP